MTSLETAKKRIDSVFEAISSTFLEEQEYHSSIKLFTDDNKVIALPCNEFLQNERSKLALSYAVQFLAIMLGNVSFITQETEAYTLALDGKTQEQAMAKFQSVISQYGSIANYPGAIEMLIVMYDDGTQCLQRSATIVKNDKNKKTLDYGHLPEDSQMSVESEGIYDNIFGGMLHKANNLRESIRNSIGENNAKLSQIKQSKVTDVWLSIGAFISNAIETDSPLLGVSIAIDAYKAIKGKDPELTFTENLITH